MITEGLIALLTNFCLFIFWIAPDWGLPDAIEDAIVYIGGYLSSFDFLFPLDTIYTIFVSMTGFTLAVVAFKLYLFVFHFWRGKITTHI